MELLSRIKRHAVEDAVENLYFDAFHIIYLKEIFQIENPILNAEKPVELNDFSGHIPIDEFADMKSEEVDKTIARIKKRNMESGLDNIIPEILEIGGSEFFYKSWLLQVCKVV